MATTTDTTEHAGFEHLTLDQLRDARAGLIASFDHGLREDVASEVARILAEVQALITKREAEER